MSLQTSNYQLLNVANEFAKSWHTLSVPLQAVIDSSEQVRTCVNLVRSDNRYSGYPGLHAINDFTGAGFYAWRVCLVETSPTFNGHFFLYGRAV